MDTTLPLPPITLRFNYKPLLLIIAIVALAFILTNYYTARKIIEFTQDDAITLAEEIYGQGEVGDALSTLPLDAAVIEKMTEEITRQLAKTADFPGCEVYLLVAATENYYPVLGYGDIITGYEKLHINDTWKVGSTKNGEIGRYPNEIYYSSQNNNLTLSGDLLRYEKVDDNLTYKQAIILEKILIYTYPLWSGHNLPKPPGCKIFR